MRQTTEHRFWDKVEVVGEDECWLWTASRLPEGYGCFWDGSYRAPRKPRIVRAHRWLYEHLHGPLGPKMEVCHSCDQPSCVNPRHLFVGTHSDNMKDMVRKGRADHSGERNGRSKLTAKQIAYIRNQATGRYGEISSFAREFGVGTGTMSKILKHQTWTNL